MVTAIDTVPYKRIVHDSRVTADRRRHLTGDDREGKRHLKARQCVEEQDSVSREQGMKARTADVPECTCGNAEKMQGRHGPIVSLMKHVCRNILRNENLQLRTGVEIATHNTLASLELCMYLTP